MNDSFLMKNFSLGKYTAMVYESRAIYSNSIYERWYFEVQIWWSRFGNMWILMEGLYPQCRSSSSRQGSSPKGMSHIVKDILEWFFSHAWEVSLLTKYTCKLSCQLINASVALTWNTRDFRLNDKTGIVWSSL